MSILINRAKSSFIPCMRTLHVNTSRSSFRQFSTSPITTTVDNDVIASIKEIKISVKNMQDELQEIRHARSQSLQNVEQLDKASTNLLDVKKAADLSKIIAFVGMVAVGLVGITAWVLTELHDKPQKAEFKEVRTELHDKPSRAEFNELRTDLKELKTELKEDIKESEKRVIESFSKEIRLALSEHENQFLKAQQNKESRK